jgi:uncharacterized protein YbbC (DUF1343 family)
MFKLKIFIVFLLFSTSVKEGCKKKEERTVSTPPAKEQTSTPPEPGQDPNAEGEPSTAEEVAHDIVVGAERLGLYLPLLKNKRVAIVVNQTSVIGDQSIVDVLLEENVVVKKIFAPEHGFRGTADAGAHIDDSKDSKTGLPIISLYGNHKKPTAEDLTGVDLVIFDIQDVGARFYTYISTMHYVMEACAENELAFMVLDRPNPNGHYVDGPLLQKSQQSFVGMHPVPVVHGMTVGEYAQMVNGEGWLANGQQVQLTVIPCQYYTHLRPYSLPIKPSPNLPNDRAIYLYPSLCFFEGTVVSIGRGTDKQFQVMGHPDYQKGAFSFTPVPKPGATDPVLKNKLCRGIDLSSQPPLEALKNSTTKIQIEWLIDFYRELNMGESFFLKNLFFDKLAGGKELREQIIEGRTAEEIRAGWGVGLEGFKEVRRKYLIYEDFE